MKLLLDQGIARSVAPLLNDAGQDAVHVGAVGMSAATDEQIIALARIQGRVVVTLDADFHNMLALTGATGPSTIRIRSEGLRSPSMTALILETIASYDELIRKDSKLPTVSSRPTSSVIRTINE